MSNPNGIIEKTRRDALRPEERLHASSRDEFSSARCSAPRSLLKLGGSMARACIRDVAGLAPLDGIRITKSAKELLVENTGRVGQEELIQVRDGMSICNRVHM